MAKSELTLEDLARSIEGIAQLVVDVSEGLLVSVSQQIKASEARLVNKIDYEMKDVRAEIADMRISMNDRFMRLESETEAIHNDLKEIYDRLPAPV